MRFVRRLDLLRPPVHLARGDPSDPFSHALVDGRKDDKHTPSPLFLAKVRIDMQRRGLQKMNSFEKNKNFIFGLLSCVCYFLFCVLNFRFWCWRGSVHHARQDHYFLSLPSATTNRCPLYNAPTSPALMLPYLKMDVENALFFLVLM